MKLPNNEIGVSDILAHRDCPRRMSFSMQRWTDEGEPPEASGASSAYGSAIHHAFFLMESELLSDEEALEAAFAEYGKWLGPEDLTMMQEDIALYHERDWDNVRTVLVEGGLRTPLLKHEGETIYFRGQIDRLYERLDQPGHFIHIDYKSSKWRKTAVEVREDPQMWAYNWLIHEEFPEIESLSQFYDQLRFGIEPTQKTAEQRRQIKKWLQVQVRAILNDEERGEDGLLLPKFNQWCPWCALLSSCSEPRKTSEFARARIQALAPADADTGKLDLDPNFLEFFIKESEKAATARKALETFEEQVKAVVRDLPEPKRVYYGFKLQGKNFDVWTPEGLRQAHEIMGDEFYSLVKLTKSRLTDYLDKEDERKARLLGLTVKEGGSPSVKKL